MKVMPSSTADICLVLQQGNKTSMELQGVNVFNLLSAQQSDLIFTLTKQN